MLIGFIADLKRPKRLKQHVDKASRRNNNGPKHGGKGFKSFGLFLAMILTLPIISKAVTSATMKITFDNSTWLKDRLIVSYI